MAKVCPMDACKSVEGMCIHDKILAAIVAIVVLYLLAMAAGLV